MLILEQKKEQEIKNMVTVLEQIDLLLDYFKPKVPDQKGA